MPPAQSYDVKLFEDIGGLKALLGSVSIDLNALVREVRALRNEQANFAASLAAVKADSGRFEARLTALDVRTNDLDGRVERLVAWRARATGMAAAGAAILGALLQVPKEWLTRLSALGGK